MGLVKSYISNMDIQDSIIINDISFNLDVKDGIVRYNYNTNKTLAFYVIIKSLDTDLTTNLLYIDTKPNCDNWTYLWVISPLKLEIHPGVKFEYYDENFNFIFSKTYRNIITSINLRLKSEPMDITYPSYQTFFYDESFKKLCNVKDGDVVYDLGANIGAFSLMCSNYDVKNIYAFEPNPSIYDYLKYNCDVYGKNVSTYKKAIYKTFESLNFGNVNGRLSQESVACSIINKDKNLCFVDGIHLEVFAIVNNLQYPTYLKVDIEGAEYDFFESTSDDFIKNCHTIFLEFHNRDERLDTLISRLTNLNYKMYFLTDKDYVLSQNMGTIFFIK